MVTNQGSAPVTIARAIAVEARDGARWTAVETELNAVESCPLGPGTRAPAPAPPPAVVVPPGRSLRVMPWLGYSCSGQCGGSCTANIYLGPGTFRFVATVLPGGARVAGPAFAMAPERRGDLMRKLLGTVRPPRGR